MQELDRVLTTRKLNLKQFENATLIPSVDLSLKQLGSLEEAKNQWLETHFYRLNVYLRDSKTVGIRDFSQ